MGVYKKNELVHTLQKYRKHHVIFKKKKKVGHQCKLVFKLQVVKN